MSILHATIPPVGSVGAIDEPQWAQDHVLSALDTQIIFSASGSAVGSSKLTWKDSTSTLTLNGITVAAGAGSLSVTTPGTGQIGFTAGGALNLTGSQLTATVAAAPVNLSAGSCQFSAGNSSGSGQAGSINFQSGSGATAALSGTVQFSVFGGQVVLDPNGNLILGGDLGGGGNGAHSDQGYDFWQPTGTGQTHATLAYTSSLIIQPNAAYAAATVKLPPTPIDGQIFEVSLVSNGVTAITWQDGAGVTGNVLGPPASTPANNGWSWKYFATLGQWIRRY